MAVQQGWGTSGASPLKYIPDGVQSPDCLEVDQVSISRYEWSLSTLCLLLRAYKIFISKIENRPVIKSNPNCNLTLPTEYNEKYYNLICMGESK